MPGTTRETVDMVGNKTVPHGYLANVVFYFRHIILRFTIHLLTQILIFTLPRSLESLIMALLTEASSVPFALATRKLYRT